MQQLLKNKTNRNCFLKWYRTAYRMRTRRIECKKDSSADLPLSALWHDRNFRYNLREAFFFLEECFKFLKIFLIRNLYFDEVGNYSKHSASESRAVEVMRNNDAFFLSLFVASVPHNKNKNGERARRKLNSMKRGRQDNEHKVVFWSREKKSLVDFLYEESKRTISEFLSRHLASD